jgi:hypothetical protein
MRYLRFGRVVLLYILKQDPKIAVKLPDTEDQVYDMVAAIGKKYKLLQKELVFAAMGGAKLYLQQSSNHEIQNAFYNGWKHDHYVTNIFLFTPDGMIRSMALNVPGCTHDSIATNYGFIYKKLEVLYNRFGVKTVVDSAFLLRNSKFLIKLAQSNIQSKTANKMLLNMQATSVRQLSEWGMRAFQGSFPRMKDCFVMEHNGDRKVMLNLIVLLYNARAHYVGINQIRNTFMQNIEKEATGIFQVNT